MDGTLSSRFEEDSPPLLSIANVHFYAKNQIHLLENPLILVDSAI